MVRVVIDFISGQTHNEGHFPEAFLSPMEVSPILWMDGRKNVVRGS